MAGLRYVFWLVTTLTIFSIMAFFAIATVDPIYQVLVPHIAAGGETEAAANIHVTIVKRMIPLFIGSAIVVTIFYLLREERQTV